MVYLDHLNLPDWMWHSILFISACISVFSKMIDRNFFELGCNLWRVCVSWFSFNGVCCQQGYLPQLTVIIFVRNYFNCFSVHVSTRDEPMTAWLTRMKFFLTGPCSTKDRHEKDRHINSVTVHTRSASLSRIENIFIISKGDKYSRVY